LEARSLSTGRGRFARRLATETKQAFKTTEFWAYVVILIGLFIAGAVSDSSSSSSSSGGGFGAQDVWLYAVVLTVGYMISRGIAKAGSRDPYWDQPDAGSDGGSISDRVRAAAQALADPERQTEREGTAVETPPTQTRDRV